MIITPFHFYSIFSINIFCQFIRGEGLIPKNPPFGGGASGAILGVLNPSPKPKENNIPRGSAARLLIQYFQKILGTLHIDVPAVSARAALAAKHIQSCYAQSFCFFP
jgi:hypothetical protein